MKTAVVILNWNGAELIKRFLPSVLAYSSGADIYVIDNASQDKSVSLLKKDFPQVKLIRLDDNYGYAGGYNRGLQQIEADIYALINSDLEVAENWLKPIQSHFEKHPETAVIQPKIKDYKDKKKFEYAGAAGGFIDFFGYPYCDGRVLFSIEKDRGQYEREKNIFWASGACMVVRSAVFKEFDGFDESFFAHQEEIDFCWRIQHRSHQIKYIPDSTVYHLGGASLSNQNPFKTYLNFRNNLMMLLKNLPLQLIPVVIFARLLSDGLTGIIFLFQGKPQHTRAVVRAHFGFYKRMPSIWNKRPKKTVKKYYNRLSIFLK